MTERVRAVAIAASTAFPPALRISTPASLAGLESVATAPLACRIRTSGAGASATAATTGDTLEPRSPGAVPVGDVQPLIMAPSARLEIKMDVV